MAPFSAYVLDKFIAPGASVFTEADIPDLSSYHSQSTHWVSSFFLNSVLRAAYKLPLNAYVYNYLRRAEAAFREHSNARTETLLFIRSNRQSPSRYAAAIFHWEIFLGQSWHAFKLLEKAFGAVLYQEGDGSVEERLNQLYNQMKHVESRIAAGQMLPEATVPVWLTNEGLVSVDARLTYRETGDVLMDIAKWADLLGDPLTVREKLSQPGSQQSVGADRDR
jgi:hypothetical protein